MLLQVLNCPFYMTTIITIYAFDVAIFDFKATFLSNAFSGPSFHESTTSRVELRNSCKPFQSSRGRRGRSRRWGTKTGGAFTLASLIPLVFVPSCPRNSRLPRYTVNLEQAKLLSLYIFSPVTFLGWPNV